MILDLQRQEIVRAGAAEIDGGNGNPSMRRGPHEAEAGIDHERGADDQHGVGLIEMTMRGNDRVARDVFAEEDHVGLEDAATPSWEACERTPASASEYRHGAS